MLSDDIISLNWWNAGVSMFQKDLPDSHMDIISDTEVDS